MSAGHLFLRRRFFGSDPIIYAKRSKEQITLLIHFIQHKIAIKLIVIFPKLLGAFAYALFK